MLLLVILLARSVDASCSPSSSMENIFGKDEVSHTGILGDLKHMCPVKEEQCSQYETAGPRDAHTWRSGGGKEECYPSDSTGNFCYQLGVNLRQKIGAVRGIPNLSWAWQVHSLMKCMQFILPTLITWGMSVRFLYPSAGPELKPTPQALHVLN